MRLPGTFHHPCVSLGGLVSHGLPGAAANRMTCMFTLLFRTFLREWQVGQMISINFLRR